MKHKFKIGDRVQFKSWKELKDEFPETIYGDIDTGNIFFPFMMKPLCNTCATIIGIKDKDKGEVELDEFSNEEFFEDKGDYHFSYSTNMLKPVKEEKKSDYEMKEVAEFKNIDEAIEYHEKKLAELKAQKEKEKCQFTEDEKVILRNLPEKYKWIARNENGELYIFTEKPAKYYEVWIYNCATHHYRISMFTHLFQCIQWSDTEPCEFRKYLGE